MLRHAPVWILCVALLACAPRAEQAAVPGPKEIAELPLRAELAVWGMFSAGRPWTMHLDWDGRGAVILRGGPRFDGSPGYSPEVMQLELSFEELEGLRRVLEEEGFFELPSVIGRPADDLYPDCVEVHLGPYVHRVEILLIDPSEEDSASASMRARRVFDAFAGHLPAEWGAARSPAWRRHLEERAR